MYRYKRARSSRVRRPRSSVPSSAAGRAVVVAISSPFSAASGSPRACRSCCAPYGIAAWRALGPMVLARPADRAVENRPASARRPPRNLNRVPTAERFWTRRLRWRLLGAWRWPTFAIFTVVDALLLHEVGTGVRFNWPVSLILASFANIGLLAVADVLARLTAR